MNYKEVSIEDLRWVCELDEFEFETTKELEVEEAILGQDKAIKAIERVQDTIYS